MSPKITLLVWACLGAARALAGPAFTVTFDAALRDQLATGRLVVYLVREGSGVHQDPAEGPFWEDPQPLFGTDVRGLAPGASAVIDDSATFFPARLSQLPKGAYRVQAVLDVHRDNSDWKREPGNLYSGVQSVTLDPARDDRFTITLAHAVAPRPPRSVPGVEWVETPSKLLTEFHHRPISLRAGVVLPIGYDPGAERRYAAVYEVPGFGGDHTGAAQHAARLRITAPDMPAAMLARESFWIVLDPESGNGHTLFADSANNGPCGEALVKELIPALEARFRLIPQPSARLLRGHSSGGWSTLWLALTYPETFGAAWSTSPDPVDFRRFQLIDIYAQRSFYEVSSFPSDAAEDSQVRRLGAVPGGLFAMTMPDGPRAIGSLRRGGKPVMSVRQEAQGEDVLGPDNTSGQQWDSWFAVFGPRNQAGHPAALFDPQTGVIDRAIAEQYRKYDIAALLHDHSDRYLRLFRENIRIAVGDQDSFYLNEAVALLKSEVDELNSKAGQTPGWGSITILPGYDHGSIMMAPALQAIPEQMLERLRQAGHAPPAR